MHTNTLRALTNFKHIHTTRINKQQKKQFTHRDTIDTLHQYKLHKQKTYTQTNIQQLFKHTNTKTHKHRNTKTHKHRNT